MLTDTRKDSDAAMSRVAFLHTGAVVISTFQDLSAELLPGVEVQHLLDDRIVADLRAGADPDLIHRRLASLVDAAALAGAQAVMLTCSSISGHAAELAREATLPVLRVDEAMADLAVETGRRIGVIATLPTTLTPTVRLIQERARLHGREVETHPQVVAGAFEAVTHGDRTDHDRRVADAVRQIAPDVDVVVLAQASMITAVDGLDLVVPILTSPALGVRRLAEQLI